nr:hypothetical protein [Tanacetum cinerariifolium]
MLERKIKQRPGFKYHKGCKEFKITHLCFADDLVVMCHGDKKSVEVIKDSLEEFSNCSGLIPNPSKSTVFFGNIGSSRLQLISSVLSSIQVYWSSVFLIPSAVVKEINRLLKGFLWVQGELTSGKAKISWSSVCKPKADGGLGIKDLSLWNKAMLIKHLWNLASRRTPYGIGNGASVSMWNDNWASVGVLSNYITHRSLYNGRLNVRIKVADMIEDNYWKWPNEWMTKYPDIVNIPVPNLKTTTDDKVIWKNKSGKIVKFSVKNVLDDLCETSVQVKWYSLLWFSQCIPKHAFNLWVAIHGRLST